MELPPHWGAWGLDLELADDVSAAGWLDDALRPWSWPGDDGPVRVASFVPDSYEAFARILHPLRWGIHGEGRWSELATPRGVAIGPATTFNEASGLRSSDGELWDRYHPSDGSLPAREMAALGAALAPHTGTPEGCVFCFWAGSGVWGSDNGETHDGHLSDEENEALNAPIRERWQRELAAMNGIPEVRLPARGHYPVPQHVVARGSRVARRERGRRLLELRRRVASRHRCCAGIARPRDDRGDGADADGSGLAG